MINDEFYSFTNLTIFSKLSAVNRSRYMPDGRSFPALSKSRVCGPAGWALPDWYKVDIFWPSMAYISNCTTAFSGKSYCTVRAFLNTEGKAVTLGKTCVPGS